MIVPVVAAILAIGTWSIFLRNRVEDHVTTISTFDEHSHDAILFSPPLRERLYSHDECREVLNRMVRNDFIKWRHQFEFVGPVLGDLRSVLHSCGTHYNSQLVAWLDDPDRFAAAHVALWLINDGRYYALGEDKWNGLHIMQSPDGTLFVDPKDQDAVKERWRRWKERKDGTIDNLHEGL
jgi:hypothetical protein